MEKCGLSTVPQTSHGFPPLLPSPATASLFPPPGACKVVHPEEPGRHRSTSLDDGTPLSPRTSSPSTSISGRRGFPVLWVARTQLWTRVAHCTIASETHLLLIPFRKSIPLPWDPGTPPWPHLSQEAVMRGVYYMHLCWLTGSGGRR